MAKSKSKKKSNQDNLDFANWCENTLARDLKESGQVGTAEDIVELVGIIRGLNDQIPKINHIDSDLDPEQCSALFAGNCFGANLDEVDRVLAGFPVYRYNKSHTHVHQWVYSLGKCDGNTAEHLEGIIKRTLNLYAR